MTAPAGRSAATDNTRPARQATAPMPQPHAMRSIRREILRVASVCVSALSAGALQRFYASCVTGIV